VRAGPAAVGTAAAVWMAGPAQAAEHLVAPGETLARIARRYGTTVERLARANGLGNPDLIVAGRRLRVPGRAAVASIHVVRAGETLSSLAARYSTTVPALARANGIEDPNLITVGSELRIPGGGSAPASPGGVAASLESAAGARGVDVSLVKAVAWQESGWRQRARSEVGAIGVMQVMPGTARYVNESLGGGDLDVTRAADNVRLGVTYLDHLLEEMPNERKALAAYLSGPGAVGGRLERYQRRYVRNVRALKPRF